MSETNEEDEPKVTPGWAAQQQKINLHTKLNHSRSMHLTLTVLSVFLMIITAVVFGVWGMMTLSPVLTQPVRPGYGLYFAYLVQYLAAMVVLFTNSLAMLWILVATDFLNLFLVSLNFVLSIYALLRFLRENPLSTGNIDMIVTTLIACFFEVLQISCFVYTILMVVARQRLENLFGRRERYYPMSGEEIDPPVRIDSLDSQPLNQRFPQLSYRRV